ncbi:MAG TPA: glycosyltransferase family 4 protein [Methylophilaceae bacterium]|nr:glycosyltransferase family 4 protein [Methylophilaceae bacterium]
MSKKRVLLFTMGNWSHSNEALVKALHERSPDWEIQTIDLLQLYKRNKRGLFFSLLDLPAILWRGLVERGLDKTSILYAPATSRFINRLACQQVEKLKPDFTMQTTTRFNACNTGVPHFTIIDITVASARQCYRNLFNSTDHALNILDSFQHKVYTNSNGVFSMGGYVRDSVVTDYQVAPYRAFSMGAGPNIKLGERSRVAASRRILFVGTDWIRKGGPDLVAAFKRVRKQHPDAELDIIGCSPEIQEPGINIIGRVPRDELHRYFTKARMFVLPTVHEAFGIVFVEALHFGLPIIATSVGAIPEMVQHEVNGYRIKPGDVEALSNAMSQLLASDPLAEQFGEASYRHAINFSWETAADVLVDKISMLLDHDRLMSRPGRSSRDNEVFQGSAQAAPGASSSVPQQAEAA